MQHLCDEVLQLIFYELPDPSALTFVARRFHRFAQDPYVRAHYFLTHYGPTEAMYYALGRGKLITERVLDILLSSGAHLSRYLIQIAIHHYFHTQAHFIKTPWVRNVSLRVFVYFLKLAEDKYGAIPRGKGEDDGSVFTTFLKESRFPPQMKTFTWENVKEILEKFNFIPFCSRDPVMAQFPLALAIEPRLLPYAVANGFHMDYKYRDFVFRKMFERPSPSSETRADDIAHNIRELCKLDSTMFVTRTVAAEVCMEAKVNDVGFSALKQLDKSGHLRFSLSNLVEDLLKTFLTTRAICSETTGDVLRHLYSEFQSSDATVRLVILIVVFVSAENLHTDPSVVHSKLEGLGLTPLTKKDAYNILVNPFVERYHNLLDYARQEIGVNEDDTKGMGPKEIRQLVEEVAVKCLEVACKGKFIKKLCDGVPSLQPIIMRLVLEKYQIRVEDVPSWEDGLASRTYVAKLSRDFLRFGVGEVHSKESLLPEANEGDKDDVDPEEDIGDMVGEDRGGDINEDSAAALMFDFEAHEGDSRSELGGITQETLTTMIRHDEATPIRLRRRLMYSAASFDLSGKLHYPHDPVHVGKWAKIQFGVKSSITAIYMTHAVINDNCHLLHNYTMATDKTLFNLSSHHVPITFKHFQILARLGRAPNFYLFHGIEAGAEFYMDEDDYIANNDQARKLLSNTKIKKESTPDDVSDSPLASPISRNHKRLRRSTTNNIRSYAVPDSDDDAIMYGEHIEDRHEKKKFRASSLQLWIKHLAELLKAEQRKYNEHKRRQEKAAEPGTKIRIGKTSFLKSLGTNLRSLRKIEAEKRQKYNEPDPTAEDYSDDDDEEYTTRRSKKRRTT